VQSRWEFFGRGVVVGSAIGRSSATELSLPSVGVVSASPVAGTPPGAPVSPPSAVAAPAASALSVTAGSLSFDGDEMSDGEGESDADVVVAVSSAASSSTADEPAGAPLGPTD
jgi:hypothetical protein